MSKGSNRRPGEILPGAWEAIFDKPSKCEDCDGTGKVGKEACTSCVPTEDGPGDDDAGGEG